MRSSLTFRNYKLSSSTKWVGYNFDYREFSGECVSEMICAEHDIRLNWWIQSTRQIFKVHLSWKRVIKLCKLCVLTSNQQCSGKIPCRVNWHGERSKPILTNAILSTTLAPLPWQLTIQIYWNSRFGFPMGDPALHFGITRFQAVWNDLVICKIKQGFTLWLQF